MKKSIMLVALLLVTATMLFAKPPAGIRNTDSSLIGFGVGAAAFYRSPVLAGQAVDIENLNVNQFSFGALGRIRFSLLQLEGLLLYSAGQLSSLDLFLDVGVGFDYSIFRLSIGAGPHISNYFQVAHPFQAGLNAKLNFDVAIGPASIGLSYLMALDIGNGIVVHTASGMLGLQCVIWL
jgi:hypothetical protein